jgi:predicted RNase H-related nuclease YkuK (DUF458 family)
MASPISDARQAIIDSRPDDNVYVGCDSIRFKKHGIWYARYATVIILHKEGSKGGRMFYDIQTMPDYGSIKQRMLNEVAFAVQHASDVIDVIGDRHFEIHIDINRSPKHKSNVALKEAAGYVLGTFGFEPKFKPESWAATHCSDHLVRLNQ